MDENKNDSISKVVGGVKKMKFFGIVLILAVVLILALFSAFGILNKNGMYRAQKIDEMNYETMPMDLYAEDEMLRMEKSTLNQSGVAGGMMLENSDSEMFMNEISTDKKIVKNGNLTIKVDRLSEAQEEISKIVKNNGGDVFSSNVYQSKDNIKRGMITVKVPVDNFEKTFEEIKKVSALVIRETTSGVDVTAEYQDLETQIKNKKAEEQSYIRILDQAQKIDDVLAVTRQLSSVRGQIERLEGKIRFMNSETSMSAIDINLSEDQDITITDSWRPLQVAKDAINSLVKSVQNFVDFVIVLIITFIPVAILYLLIILIMFLIIRKIYRRFRKNSETK